MTVTTKHGAMTRMPGARMPIIARSSDPILQGPKEALGHQSLIERMLLKGPVGRLKSETTIKAMQLVVAQWLLDVDHAAKAESLLARLEREELVTAEKARIISALQARREFAAEIRRDIAASGVMAVLDFYEGKHAAAKARLDKGEIANWRFEREVTIWEEELEHELQANRHVTEAVRNATDSGLLAAMTTSSQQIM